MVMKELWFHPTSKGPKGAWKEGLLPNGTSDAKVSPELVRCYDGWLKNTKGLTNQGEEGVQSRFWK